MATETSTRTRRLSISVLGAGVIGQVYAALLWDADLQVTLLARGKRAEQLRRDGIRYRCLAPEPHKGRTPVPVQESTEPVEADVLILAVRAQDLPAALEIAERIRPQVLVTLMRVVGHRREPQQRFSGIMVTQAFPGIRGYRETDGTIVWAQVSQQSTTVDANSSAGELVRTLFRRTGLPTAAEPLMQHWLHTHNILTAGLSVALLRADGRPRAAAEDPALLRDMVAALRDGVHGYRKCGGKVRPGALALVLGLPTAFARSYWRREFLGHLAEINFASHVRQSRHGQLPLICQEALRLTGGHAPRLERWLAPHLPPQTDPDEGPGPASSS